MISNHVQTLIKVLYMRNGIFPAILVNEDVKVKSNYRPPTWVNESWQISGRKIIFAVYQPSDYSHSLQPLPLVSPKELRMWKHRILAPGSWDAYQRNDFSEPRLLHLPIYRRVLNFLTWDILFSSINSQFLMFWLPALCYKISIYLLLPPTHPPTPPPGSSSL